MTMKAALLRPLNHHQKLLLLLYNLRSEWESQMLTTKSLRYAVLAHRRVTLTVTMSYRSALRMIDSSRVNTLRAMHLAVWDPVDCRNDLLKFNGVWSQARSRSRRSSSTVPRTSTRLAITGVKVSANFLLQSSNCSSHGEGLREGERHVAFKRISRSRIFAKVFSGQTIIAVSFSADMENWMRWHGKQEGARQRILQCYSYRELYLERKHTLHIVKNRGTSLITILKHPHMRGESQ